MNATHSSLSERFPNRATHWQLRTRVLKLDRRPLLMGIVNVTPDSFSDGGKFFSPDTAIQQALQLAEEGADILDIGGESTRPYAETVSAQQEQDRVIPVLEALADRIEIPISIDTTKSLVAQAAIVAGAEIINDVTGLEGDPAMPALAANTHAAVCAMHMQGSPKTMQDNPQYNNVVEEIYAYLQHRRDTLLAAGIEASRICLDPGIGFGKTHQHNFTLMANCSRFHTLGCPLLVGHSRKGFLAKILADKTTDRTYATLGSALSLATQGVQIIRVHNIRPIREALLAFEATGGIESRD